MLDNILRGIALFYIFLQSFTMCNLEDSWILTSALNLLKYVWVEVYKENPVSVFGKYRTLSPGRTSGMLKDTCSIPEDCYSRLTLTPILLLRRKREPEHFVEGSSENLPKPAGQDKNLFHTSLFTQRNHSSRTMEEGMQTWKRPWEGT